jgi:hypothetical protein
VNFLLGLTHSPEAVVMSLRRISPTAKPFDYAQGKYHRHLLEIGLVFAIYFFVSVATSG